MKLTKLLFVIIIISLYGCTKKIEEKGTAEYILEIKEWHARRIENLKKENGWLNLIGLFWLKEGENKFGSDKSNDILYPEFAPKFIGTFIFKDSIVQMKVNKGIEIFTNDSERINDVVMKHDQEKGTTFFNYGSLRWNLIKRGNQYGIRLRDLNSELVKNFPGIEMFPINEDWRIKANFEKYDPPREIDVPTVLGTIEKEKSPGVLIFSIDNKVYRLDVTDAGKSYFVIFADLTNGKETYGAGRFLSVDKPDSTGEIFIDFNKSYNPPCAFTKYATCPLPPKQNYLNIKVTAGEKNFGEGH